MIGRVKSGVVKIVVVLPRWLRNRPPLPDDSVLLPDISAIMQNNGVVKGEFGLVNAFKQKRRIF